MPDCVGTDPELAGVRDALMLVGCEFLPLESYNRIVDMENQATVLGYAEVA